MSRRRISAGFAVLAALTVFGCSGDPVSDDTTGTDVQSPAVQCPTDAPRPAMGLMTSLPLTYPLDAEFADFARGEVERTWQAKVFSQCFSPLPLDTLSVIGGLDPAVPATDPLLALDYLAVIQPRGLSPQDNVALDDWVRAGGKLLLVLDPMLTGEYDLPLGDPRRPSAIALIPPVVERWGMQVTYDDSQEFAPGLVAFDGSEIPVLLAGEVSAAQGVCVQDAPSAVRKCAVGEGSVTLVADAAIFEDQELAGRDGDAIHTVLAFAFGP